MKFGFSLFSFSQDIELYKILPRIKEAGYDGVELILSERGYLNCDLSDDEIIRIRETVFKYGLEIPSIGVWSLWENNLISNNDKIREKAFKIVKRQIEIASLTGADTILVVPGYVGCNFVNNPERIRYDIALKRCKEMFDSILPIAEEYKIKIGIENVWNKFLLSPVEMKNFVDSFDSEYMGVYFDTGNIIYNGYPEDWIKILGNRIKKIHLSDFREEVGNINGFVDLFAGDVNFKNVCKSLNKINYDDYLILEMFPNYKMFPEISMYSNFHALIKIKELLNSK